MNRQDGSGENGRRSPASGETGSVETVLSCGEDQAQRIRDIFYKAAGCPLDQVTVVPSELKGTLLMAQCGNFVYYLKVTSVNRLREIRKDDPKGKVVYQVLY